MQRKVAALAEQYREQMIKFLRDMIAIPSESGQEGAVIQRIGEEMEGAGFDQVAIDPMGNILGRVGSGPRVLAFDAHVDTVGMGSPEEWDIDPYRGKLADGIVYGRGACDQTGAMASMVYAGKIIRELGLAGEFSIYMVGSVQEEDCDGLCWQYIINEGGLNPELVVITEPTNLNVYRGHRGRMELRLATRGVSCHGSAPERGENAITKMAPLIEAVDRLNSRLRYDDFLGKGTVCVTYIQCHTPSLCAVPDRCEIHLDRRLTQGEDKELALAEVRQLCQEAGVEAEVRLLRYDTPSYTGLVYPVDKYYPTWVVPEQHPAVLAAVETVRRVSGRTPTTGKWGFSTNGVAIMGRHGIPCVGFGPGNEVHAHAVTDQVPVRHLVEAAKFYALYPTVYGEK